MPVLLSLSLSDGRILYKCRHVLYIAVKLNGGRAVTGFLRGFDPFMNLVIDETVEEGKTGEKNSIGMVVRQHSFIDLVRCIKVVAYHLLVCAPRETSAVILRHSTIKPIPINSRTSPIQHFLGLSCFSFQNSVFCNPAALTTLLKYIAADVYRCRGTTDVVFMIE